MKRKKSLFLKVILSIFILLVFGLFNYFWLIPLNIRYANFFLLCLCYLFFLALLFFIPLFDSKYITIKKEVIESKVPSKKFYLLCLGCMIVTLVYFLSSSPLFCSKQYQSLIGSVEEKEFIGSVSMIDTQMIPIIDKEYATKLGDKKLGLDRGLGSEYHVGTFSDITIQGKMYLVAPLEFNGFFKWIRNKTTPGYVKIDKTTGAVELITSVQGKSLALKYLPSAYFHSNLRRHAYFHGNMDNEIVETTFEVDDMGNPYFVLNKIHKTIGISGGAQIKSVVVVDCQTGKVAEYSPEEAPDWIDTIYPKSLVLKQLDDWGFYVHGYFNTLFSEKDIVRVTDGSREVLNDGNLYHYTGMTSNGKDDSTVGFAFVNTRTKETRFYQMTGATEQAAMQSAEGKVENYGYQATFPLPLNLSNQPTFFTTLKDKNGLIKQYAFVHMENYSTVGTGDTITEAFQSYTKAMFPNTLPEESEELEITGKIARLGSAIQDGITTYYFMLENHDNLFYGTILASNHLPVTKVGDYVKIRVCNNRVIQFKNLEIEG